MTIDALTGEELAKHRGAGTRRRWLAVVPGSGGRRRRVKSIFYFSPWSEEEWEEMAEPFGLQAFCDRLLLAAILEVFVGEPEEHISEEEPRKGGGHRADRLLPSKLKL